MWARRKVIHLYGSIHFKGTVNVAHFWFKQSLNSWVQMSMKIHWWIWRHFIQKKRKKTNYIFLVFLRSLNGFAESYSMTLWHRTTFVYFVIFFQVYMMNLNLFDEVYFSIWYILMLPAINNNKDVIDLGNKCVIFFLSYNEKPIYKR